MRVIVIGDGRFALKHRDDPTPGRGEVVVATRSAGLNAADLQQARGAYPAPAGWPADVPGLEIAGEVRALGSAVTGLEPGDRVMALVGGGGHAEQIVVPADLLLPVPQGVSWEQAGGFSEAFSTAWDALVTQARVSAGARVLITGAAGGVGTAMIQIAAVSGADVVASVRSSALHEKVRSLVPGESRLAVVTPDEESDHGPFDVIIDLVGADGCLKRLSLLRTYGKLVIVGYSGVPTPPLPIYGLMQARASIIGTTIRTRTHAEKAVLAQEIRTRVVPLLAQGRLRVPIEAAYALDEFDAAYSHLAGSGKFGKIILMP